MVILASLSDILPVPELVASQLSLNICNACRSVDLDGERIIGSPSWSERSERAR